MNFAVGPRTILFSLGKKGLLLLALASQAAQGAPLDELRTVAQLPRFDVARLKSGEIIIQRGPPGDFPRGIFLESCYFVHAPIETFDPALLHWDPIQHHDPGVSLYGEYTLPGAPDVFKKLQLNPGTPGDRWLLNQTARAAETGVAGELHLTKEEVAILRQITMRPGEAWQEILRRRSAALAGGGLAAVPPYGSDKSISPGSEFRGLLSLAPNAARHFRSIIEAPPLAANGKEASEAVAYWEGTKVRDHTTLQLGLVAAARSADSWQLVDCVYYPSDTYFMELNLYQLWPLGGGTLVWQVAFVSAPFRSYLGGVDRYVAGKQMVEETLDTIKAFRAEAEKAH